MSKTVLFLSIDTSGYQPGKSIPPFVDYQDFYELGNLEIEGYNGIYLAGWCDQLYLETQEAKLSAFVRAGGRLFINGHPLRKFVEGLPSHRPYTFHGMNDLTMHNVSEHPIWAGVDMEDVWLKTGVPGSHSTDELKEIGVAGFYARSYLTKLPENCQIINALGPYKLPVDVSYRLGEGEVVLHNGLELPIFVYKDKSTKDLGKNMFAWLQGSQS